MVSFMQVYDDRFQAEAEWNAPDDGQKRCPKHVEFYNRINVDN
jgi:hypothetical protein